MGNDKKTTMKHLTRITTSIILFVIISQNAISQNNRENSPLIRDFIDFLYKFREYDSSFHKSHITFPLEYSIENEKLLLQENSYEDSIINNKSILYYFFGFFLFTAENNSKSFAQKTDKIILSQIDSSNIVDYYFTTNKDGWNLIKIGISKNNLELDNSKDSESFENFIAKFIRNNSFRESRIDMPYKFIAYDIMGGSETILINKDNINYYFKNFKKVFIVYDNFEKKRPSLEKVNLGSTGNMNGMLFGYIFKFKNGKWHLDRGWDMSN